MEVETQGAAWFEAVLREHSRRMPSERHLFVMKAGEHEGELTLMPVAACFTPSGGRPGAVGEKQNGRGWDS